MKFNYQIMREINENGNYIPDMEELRNNASCQEEIEYLNKVEERWEKYKKTGHSDFIGCSFNMCYVMRQACGHFELFQHYVHNEKEAMEWLEFSQRESKNRKCTCCISNKWSD